MAIDKSRTHTPVEGYQIEDLRTKSIKALTNIAAQIGVENPSDYRRQDLIFEISKRKSIKADLSYFRES